MQYEYFDSSFFDQVTVVVARLMLYKENPKRSFVEGLVREIQCTNSYIVSFANTLRTFGGDLKVVKDNENFTLYTVHDNLSQVGELVVYK